jgi:hypothetical protein
MWNVCLDTVKDRWQVIIFDKLTKRRIAKGKLTKGRNNAMSEFTKEMQSEDLQKLL